MDEENIAELETLIRRGRKGPAYRLDLKDLTLAGQDGVDFLARCEAAGITLVNCASVRPRVDHETKQWKLARAGLIRVKTRNDPHS